MLKSTLKRILPQKSYNFLRMRPIFVLISSSIWCQVKDMNYRAWAQDPDNRGDIDAAFRKLGHILDKGLQSTNRLPGHSLKIANDLKTLLSKSTKKESESFIWAKNICDYHHRLQMNDLPSTEYSEFEFQHANPIDYECLFSLLKERRSIRHYDPNLLPEKDDIINVLKGAVWAPSSCNRQTITCFFTCNSDLASQCLRQNKGATLITGKFSFVCVCYDTRSYHLPQESLTGLIDVSLGFQNCLLLAHASGLGACILNWSHADAHEDTVLRRLLSIPEYYSIAFNVIIGRPKFGAPVPVRKSESQFIIER